MVKKKANLYDEYGKKIDRIDYDDTDEFLKKFKKKYG